jgi:glutamine---fructose-6-phosphate transaminase (isomerizing)
MCGIVGVSSKKDVVAFLLAGLQRLAYRGYDSAGLVVLDKQHNLQRRRALGKVENLIHVTTENPISGTTGIAHTRWATHGLPSEANAHPHTSHNLISIVHNGIIENFSDLRDMLSKKNYCFTSETDSEVIAHLLHYYITQEKTFLSALLKLKQTLSGAYALAIISQDTPEKIWAIRQGSPLVLGIGDKENFLASDQLALLPVTQQFIYPQEGDMICLTAESIDMWDQQGTPVTRTAITSNTNYTEVNKGVFRHFMLKEIFEQPQTLAHVIQHCFAEHRHHDRFFNADAHRLLLAAKHIYILACGTSYNAGLTAKYWFEALAGIPCYVEVASEFRYRHPVVPNDTLLITISQSGETADTLAALRLATTMNFIGTLTLCNVAESALVRESDAAIFINAGPEIGVASTKAFTNQLLTLFFCVLTCAQQAGKNIAPHMAEILDLPAYVNQILTIKNDIQACAEQFMHVVSALFIGRGAHFPIAAEGALKLKELSYIHAESYPAGELKHGPLALVDAHLPIILLAPNNALLEKTYSNAQEIKARHGKLLIFTDAPERFQDLGTVLTIPSMPDCLSPIVYTIPLQLFAYYVAVSKGTDVDQPRNLAKSVTVE